MQKKRQKSRDTCKCQKNIVSLLPVYRSHIRGLYERPTINRLMAQSEVEDEMEYEDVEYNYCIEIQGYHFLLIIE